jgi:uncharacterized protein YodC (DUF2158 family)
MNFQVGDVVRLKSFGPSMTVDLVRQDTGEVQCVWFWPNQPMRAETQVFKPQMLEKVK